MDQKIIIHYDFVDGSELAFGQAVIAKADFTTNCLNFFCCDNINAKLIRADGKSIAVKDLLAGKGDHTDKCIRKPHNLCKMLIAGKFKW